MIIVGGGARGASSEIRKVAKILEGPVSCFRLGRGVLDSRHHLSVTMPTGHRLWKNVDVALGVGTRMQAQQQLWGTDRDLKIIRIDLSAEEMDPIVIPDIGILGYASTVLTELENVLPKYNNIRTSRKEELDEARTKTLDMLSPLAPQLAYIDAIRNALPEEG